MRCKTAIGLITCLAGSLLCLCSNATLMGILVCNVATSTCLPVIALIIEPLAIGVTGCSNLVSGVCITALTGIGSIACLSAGRISNNSIVTVCDYGNVLGLNITTLTAGLGLKTFRSTCRSLSYLELAIYMLVNFLCLEEIVTVLTALAGLEVIGGLAAVSGNEVLLALNSLIECVEMTVVNNNLNRRSCYALLRGDLYTTLLCSKCKDSSTVFSNEILNLAISKGKGESSLAEVNVMAAYSLIDGINSVCPIKSGEITCSNAVPGDVREIYIANAYAGNETTKGKGETLLELVKKHGHISLPILLMFPNKTIYTVELLRSIFDEFSKQAEGVFNEKFKIDATQLQHN